MALPMDEQRILEEMERMLAADDPKLAARLAAFGQPGVGHVLRTRRARAVLSLLTLGVVACVAAVIYMVNVFHWTGNQFTPDNLRSSQPATNPARSLYGTQKFRVPGNTVHCVILAPPNHCTTLGTSGGSSAAQPSPVSDQPAKAAH
jgi:hypothetical protein